ncbi:uncharacterized protein [Rutidosis leptorrhynchoides]|uniref:uncharacterized protein n=1 Tax=Rutidosis leptorrhynchoides TaxID=125765 RepID=UPI003A99B7AB
MFSIIKAVTSEFFLAVRGNWVGSGKESIIVNIYGPHNDAGKKEMWHSLDGLLDKIDSSWLLCGDFNEVRFHSDRLNSVFRQTRATRFNEFITRNGLIDIPINALDRLDSDHCPLILRDKVIDFGPKPFKIFDEWFNKYGVDNVVIDGWNKVVHGVKKDCVFRERLTNVKVNLKEWSKNLFGNLDTEIKNLKALASCWEQKSELGNLSDQDRICWLETRKRWLEKEKIKANMLKQKARIRWALEEPAIVKSTAVAHFQARFAAARNRRPRLLGRADFSGLELNQIDGCATAELEYMFSESEVWEAVKGCEFEGPGPGWNWIISCLKSASISILVNGSSTHEFSLERGVRQGDPLSPFLFILATKRLKVNYNKSNLYGVGVDCVEVDEMSNMFGCCGGSLPFIYLGLPVGGKMKKLDSWKPFTVLLLLVLNSPAMCAKKIGECKAFFFFWDGSGNNSKIAWVNWDETVLPFGKVGLNLGSLNCENLALIGCTIDELGLPFRVSFFRVIGDGASTKFWEHIWLGNVPLKNRFSRLAYLDSDISVSVKERLSWNRSEYIGIWDWVRALSRRAENELAELSELLKSVRINSSVADSWRWDLCNNGKFTTKFLYDLVAAKVLNSYSSNRETLYNGVVPKKVGVFVWRLLKNRLPALTELDKRGVDLNSVRCAICDDDV